MSSHEIERKPVIVKFEDNSTVTETYGFVGSQGYVFKAEQLGTRRLVALKVVREGVFASKGERRRFESSP